MSKGINTREIGDGGEELAAATLRRMRFRVEHLPDSAAADLIASKGNVRYAINVKLAGIRGTFSVHRRNLARLAVKYPDCRPALMFVSGEETYFFVLRQHLTRPGEPLTWGGRRRDPHPPMPIGTL